MTWVSIADAVSLTGLSKSSLYEAARAGLVPGARRYPVGGWKLPLEGVEQFRDGAVVAPRRRAERPRSDARALIGRVKEQEVMRGRFAPAE